MTKAKNTDQNDESKAPSELARELWHEVGAAHGLTSDEKARGLFLKMDRWGLAFCLSSLAGELLARWPQYQQELAQTVTVEQSFVDDWQVQATDGDSIAGLLLCASNALTGMGSWAELRRAFNAAIRPDPLLQQRQAKCVKKCEHALNAWKRVDRRKRKGETAEDLAQRIEPTEIKIGKLLALGLREHERAFRKLTPGEARRLMTGHRSNVSATKLLEHVAIKTGVAEESWPNVSQESLREAVRAQTRKGKKATTR